MEPRFIAYTSGDHNFIKDYEDGKDIYMELARAYKPHLPDDVLRAEYRSKCKSLVLAIFYGMGDETLSHNLDMTLEEVREFKRVFFTKYSIAGKLIERKVKYCEQHGKIETFYGDLLRADPARANTIGISQMVPHTSNGMMKIVLNAGTSRLGYWYNKL